MLRCKLWLTVAFLCTLIFTPAWIVNTMQNHISLLNVQIATLKRQLNESETYAREYATAFAQSAVHIAVRQYYTYSASQAAKLSALKQNDSEVIQHIKNKLLIPPPAKPKQQDMADRSKGHSAKILSHFKNMTGGFFIECGALDGVYLSNTVHLEAKYNWTGLLIEAEPNNFRSLMEKQRNAWLLPTCLSITGSPAMISFSTSGAFSKISESGTKVQCMPLYSILLALNRTSIDFFSLDIEGNELDVLRTLPFDKVDIKTLAVEHSRITEGREKLLDFMLKQGYYELPSLLEERTNDRWAQEDYIFIKNITTK